MTTSALRGQTVLYALLLAGCASAAVGDPCEVGDECGSELICVQPEGGSATCTERSDACEEEPDACDCDDLIALCEHGYACVTLDGATALTCTE